MYCVKAPPTRGPATIPIFEIPIMIPMINGLLSNGTVAPMIVNEPLKSPPDPMPETARPMMNSVEVLERAQMRDPASKTKRKARKISFE